MYASVNSQVIIGSGNGLSPVQCQAIIWTNANLLSVEQIQSNPVISRAVNSRKSVSRACTLDPKF